MTIRLFNLVLALANIYTILACLRLMFPEHPRRWVLGLMVAGFLPVFVYLYQTPLNHCLAGTLASLTLYLVLRILCLPNASTRDYAFAGLALGVGDLSIVSAAVLVVPVGIALAAKYFVDRARIGRSQAAFGILLLGLITFAVCGWHYLYLWVNLGTPIVGNMGFGVGSPFAWWQDPGFQASGDYLRFGESLRSPLFEHLVQCRGRPLLIVVGRQLCRRRRGPRIPPPWSYDYLVAGMLLALVPTTAALLGAVAAIFGFLRKPTITWAFLLGTAFAIGLFVTYCRLLVPYYSAVKASYGLAGSVPLCVLATLGFDLLAAFSRRLRGLVFVVLGVWTLNVIATYRIAPTAADTRRYLAEQELAHGNIAEAIHTLELSLVEHPHDDLTRVRLAKLYLMEKRTDSARQMLEPSAGQRDFCSRHFLFAILLVNEGAPQRGDRRISGGDETGSQSCDSGTRLRRLRIRRAGHAGGHQCLAKCFAHQPVGPRCSRGPGAALPPSGRPVIGSSAREIFPCSGRVEPADRLSTILTRFPLALWERGRS